jgi:hypothetical protein
LKVKKLDTSLSIYWSAPWRAFFHNIQPKPIATVVGGEVFESPGDIVSHDQKNPAP